jgi:hypothetical protein
MRSCWCWVTSYHEHGILNAVADVLRWSRNNRWTRSAADGQADWYSRGSPGGGRVAVMRFDQRRPSLALGASRYVSSRRRPRTPDITTGFAAAQDGVGRIVDAHGRVAESARDLAHLVARGPRRSYGASATESFAQAQPAPAGATDSRKVGIARS